MHEKINKETLQNLLTLSRIELTDEEKKTKEAKLLKDLEGIIGHFDELAEVDTDGVDLVEGSRTGVNEYRKDEERTDFRKEDAISQFPETNGGYLKVPAILEHKKNRKNEDS